MFKTELKSAHLAAAQTTQILYPVGALKKEI